MYLNAAVAAAGTIGYAAVAFNSLPMVVFAPMIAFFFATPLCWAFGIGQLVCGTIIRLVLGNKNRLVLHSVVAGSISTLSLVLWFYLLELGYVVAV